MGLENSKLYYSERSPFARRVRIACRQAGVPLSERVVDLFSDLKATAPDFVADSELGRVPLLVLASGQKLADSHLILIALTAQVGREHLWPTLESLHLSGMAMGLCEWTVAAFLETKRSPSKQEDAVMLEFRELAERTLASFNLGLADFPLRPSQADWDVAIALDYIALRGCGVSLEAYPECVRFLSEARRRPLFSQTRPPEFTY